MLLLANALANVDKRDIIVKCYQFGKAEIMVLLSYLESCTRVKKKFPCAVKTILCKMRIFIFYMPLFCKVLPENTKTRTTQASM